MPRKSGHKEWAPDVFVKVGTDETSAEDERVSVLDQFTALVNAAQRGGCSSGNAERIEPGRSIHDLMHSIQPALDCNEHWNSMHGSDCERRCSKCRLTVIKPDGLSESAFSELLSRSEPALSANELKLFRRPDGTLTVGDCYVKRCPAPEMVGFAFSTPLCWYSLVWMLAPGYIVPFVNHPVGRSVFIAALVWHALGCTLYSRIRNRFLGVAVVVFFMLPLLMCPLFSPGYVGCFGPIESPNAQTGRFAPHFPNRP